MCEPYSTHYSAIKPKNEYNETQTNMLYKRLIKRIIENT